MNSVGERIREARIAKGLTQEQLARGLATKGFVSQVERNHARPSLPKLRLMADRLGLPLSHFLGELQPQQLTYLRKSAELCVRAGEPERALDLIREALPLPVTANERADLFRIQGMAHDRLRQFEEALTAHQAAAAAAPPDDPDLMAAIYVEIGTVLQEQERFNAAHEANLRALDWFHRSKHPDPGLRARALTNLGVESFELGQSDQAIAYLHEALSAATDAESLLRLAKAHMALGIAARATGEIDRAIEHCNRALEMHRRLGEDQFANRILNNLGDAHFAAGRRREARQYQSRCLERARQLDDSYEVGVAGGALAHYLLEEGDLEKAVALARESQAAAERAGDHLHQATSMAIEGRAAERQGNPDLADRRFRAAFKLLLERQAASKLAEVCGLYSEVLRSRGDVDRAFALLRMASDRDFKSLPGLLRRRNSA